MYSLILMDPAWQHTGSATKNAAAGKHYACMQWEEIHAMPIKAALNKKAAVFMWATGPLLHKQIECFERWGLFYRGVAFVWVKTRADGGIIQGQGVPPTFVKPTTEFLLAGSTVRTGRPIPIIDSSIGQVVLAPREEHSKKPDVFYDRIEQLFDPGVPKLELFARHEREGWDATGLELDGTDYRSGRIIPERPFGLPF